MCGLNELFCTALVAAKTPDGSTVDLLNCPGGHHEFVYGNSETFPEVSMRHLVAHGLTTEDEYRSLAVAERIRSLTNPYGYLRAVDKDYIEGRIAAPVPDSWMSSQMWCAAVLPKLQKKRYARVLSALADVNGDRYATLVRLDEHAELEKVTSNVLSGSLRFNEIEERFARGKGSIAAGTGAVSRSYVKHMLTQRVKSFVLTLRTRNNEYSDRSDDLRIATDLCPVEATALHTSLNEYRQVISVSSRPGRKRKKVFNNLVKQHAFTFAGAVEAKLDEMIAALEKSGIVVIRQPETPAAQQPELSIAA